MVLLKIQSEQALLDWAKKLDRQQYALFTEPDIGDQATALATLDTGEMFRSLPLL